MQVKLNISRDSNAELIQGGRYHDILLHCVSLQPGQIVQTAGGECGPREQVYGTILEAVGWQFKDSTVIEHCAKVQLYSRNVGKLRRTGLRSGMQACNDCRG